MADSEAFYDELSEYYDLIFEDWNASMLRQGEAIAGLLERYGVSPPAPILDAAAGIGTQSLPLAARGFEVTSRDLSSGAIARLKREAMARGLSIDAAAADMRALGASEAFDAVLALDNSVPHLVTDDDLVRAFRSFYDALRPGGVCLISVRDYDKIARGGDSVHPYGVRFRGQTRYIPFQVWHWVSPTHYDVSLYVVEDVPGTDARVRRMTARYYAISTGRLLELLVEAGFTQPERLNDVLYQPVLAARRRA